MAAKVNKDTCIGCGECVSSCPLDAIAVKEGKAEVDEGTCAECGACVDACPHGAITL